MPKEKMWVEWDDGSHLSRSRKKPGSYSSLTREDGTNGLGNVTLSPLDESEMDDPVGSRPFFSDTISATESSSRVEEPVTIEDIMELVILINRVIDVAERAAPHIKALWNSRARPAIKSARSRIAGARKLVRRAAREEPSALASSAFSEASPDAMTEVEEPAVRMSSSEARERFVSALAARLLSEEQLTVLRNARIEDDVDPSQLESAVGALTVEQVWQGIQLALEADPSLAGRKELAELEAFLARRLSAGSAKALNA